MCGRVTLTRVSYEELARELSAVPHDPHDAAHYKPRFNVAPTDLHWIVHPTPELPRVLDPARWGLVNWWAHDKKRAASQINARVESVASSRAFREAYAKRRCVVPIDGWLEWTGDAKSRKPSWFHHADGSLILLAGLWEDWREPGSEKDEQLRTFTVLTTAAKGLAANYHDRMPIRVPRAAVDQWLTEKISAEEILAGEMDDETVVATAVSDRVNSVKNDDPACLEPAK